MYFHPDEPNPYRDQDETAGFVILLTIITLPACVLAFAVGYGVGAWGVL